MRAETAAGLACRDDVPLHLEQKQLKKYPLVMEDTVGCRQL